MSCIFSHLSQGPWYYASHVSTPNWIKNGLLLGEKWLRKLWWLLPLNNAGAPAALRVKITVMVLENVNAQAAQACQLSLTGCALNDKQGDTV